MRYRFSAITVVLWAAMVIVVAPARANCKRAPRNQECLGCANIVVQMEDAKSGTNVTGTVYDNQAEPFEGVLVEVFAQSAKTSHIWELTNAKDDRLAACFVGKDGSFQLHLRPGMYEMRFSVQPGWNCTYQKIAIVKNLHGEALRIRMSLGT